MHTYRLVRVRKTTPVLRIGSLHVQRHRGRVVEFEDASNRDGSRVERESDGRRPSERRAKDGGTHGVNLPLLLVAHLGRSERHEDVKFAIHGLCIDDSLVINARRRADSFVVFRLWLDIRLLSYSTVHNPWSSLIPLSRGSFDMIMGMDWLSKRKFMIVCHEKVVRVPLEGDEILRVHGEQDFIDELLKIIDDQPRRQLEFPHSLGSWKDARSRSLHNVITPSEMQEYIRTLQEFKTRGFHTNLVNFCEEHLISTPRIDDLFEQNEEPCPFLKDRFSSGYHQLRMHEDAIIKIAFRTRYRHFESTVIPFGLNNAPTSKEEHEVHLKLVLESLRKEKPYAKFSKCSESVSAAREREKNIATYVSNCWICLRGEGCNVKDFWLVATA
ncbi:hypothetical protein Tco_0603938 [Tanacetum coccineum]